MALRADDVDLLRDRALVERFQAGDVDGFEDLYRRYFSRLYRFCVKRLDGDPHEAEEVAQEAFVRALRAMPDLGGERKFYPWLTVIAARLCVDAHRRRGRSVPTAEIDLGVIEGGQDAIVEAVDHALVAQAMTQISDRHREVLQLREERGWSYQRIADHYDVTQGTIEALLFRARRALRKEFMSLNAVDGRLAGVPVVGWLIRRGHNAQTKLQLWASQGLTQLASVALPLAVVASSAGAAGGAARVSPSPARPATSTIASSTPLVETPSVLGATSVKAHAAPVRKNGPVASPTAAPRIAFERSRSSEDARGRATVVEVGPVVFGTDLVEAAAQRIMSIAQEAGDVIARNVKR